MLSVREARGYTRCDQSFASVIMESRVPEGKLIRILHRDPIFVYVYPFRAEMDRFSCIFAT